MPLTCAHCLTSGLLAPNNFLLADPRFLMYSSWMTEPLFSGGRHPHLAAKR